MGCINYIGCYQSSYNMSSALDGFRKKSLLQRVEESGGTRESIDLKQICDLDTQTFGASGSQQRRTVQKYWAYVRRSPFPSYRRALERYDIEPGSGTRRCMLNMSYNSKDNDDDFLIDDEAPDDSLLENGYAMLKPSNKTTTNETVDKDLGFISPKPTKTTTVTDHFSNLSINPELLFSPVRNCKPSSSHRVGTKGNPHIICVDTKFPEAHREFDIEEIDRIEHEHWAVKGYHIRTDVGCHDKKEWIAKMVMYNGEPDKAILIKGKTRKSCYNELATYHHTNTLKFVKEKHLKTKAQLKENADRDYSFWLLVFPQGVVLDNSILSGNNKTVLMKTSGTSEMKGTGNFLTLIVYWQIAVKNDDYFNADSDNDDEFDFAALPTP